MEQSERGCSMKKLVKTFMALSIIISCTGCEDVAQANKPYIENALQQIGATLDRPLKIDMKILEEENIKIDVLNVPTENIPSESMGVDIPFTLTNIPIESSPQSLMNAQWEIEQQILMNYKKQSYTPAEPYIVLNPYGTTPLSALVMFDTAKAAKVTVTVLGKDEFTNITHTFSQYNRYHEIPVVGLYADYPNQVEMQLEFDDGTLQSHIIDIKTPPVKIDATIDLVLNDNATAGITFVNSTIEQILGLDVNADVRWIMNYYTRHVLHRLANGNWLIGNEQSNVARECMFEVDLLGKIYANYNNSQSAHDDAVDLANGHYFKPPTGQHSPMIIPDQDNNPNTTDVVVYDNNQGSVLKYNNEFDGGMYSRMVQYRIDELDMSVEQILSPSDELGIEYYTINVNDVDVMDNIVGSVGGANTGTILEVDKASGVVNYEVDLKFSDKQWVYRAEKMPMYPDEWDFALAKFKGIVVSDNTYETTTDFETMDIMTLPNNLSIYQKIEKILLTDELCIEGYQAVQGDMAQGANNYLVFTSPTVTKAITLTTQPTQSDVLDLLNKLLKDESGYNSSGFVGSIPLNYLKENLPREQYHLGILTEVDGEFYYQQTEYYISVV